VVVRERVVRAVARGVEVGERDGAIRVRVLLRVAVDRDDAADLQVERTVVVHHDRRVNLLAEHRLRARVRARRRRVGERKGVGDVERGEARRRLLVELDRDRDERVLDRDSDGVGGRVVRRRFERDVVVRERVVRAVARGVEVGERDGAIRVRVLLRVAVDRDDAADLQVERTVVVHHDRRVNLLAEHRLRARVRARRRRVGERGERGEARRRGRRDRLRNVGLVDARARGKRGVALVDRALLARVRRRVDALGPARARGAASELTEARRARRGVTLRVRNARRDAIRLAQTFLAARSHHVLEIRGVRIPNRLVRIVDARVRGDSAAECGVRQCAMQQGEDASHLHVR